MLLVEQNARAALQVADRAYVLEMGAVVLSGQAQDLLHDRRMTLTELADKVDITLANLSILKTGKARAIRFSTLAAICEALECQPGELLGYEP